MGSSWCKGAALLPSLRRPSDEEAKPGLGSSAPADSEPGCEATHWVLILLVCPGLPDVPIVGGGPLILGRAPLLPQYGLSLVLLPVQVGPVRQAGSTHHLPEGREELLVGCAQAPQAGAPQGTAAGLP